MPKRFNYFVKKKPWMSGGVGELEEVVWSSRYGDGPTGEVQKILITVWIRDLDRLFMCNTVSGTECR